MERFEKLTSGVSQIYKSIRKIKSIEMDSIGLKGTHVLCLYYLSANPDGITATDLCAKCIEDKAAISRTLYDLERLGLVCYSASGDRKYRTKALLTPDGYAYAEMMNKLITRATLAAGEGISDEEREVFYRILFHIADQLDSFLIQIENEKNNHLQNAQIRGEE